MDGSAFLIESSISLVVPRVWRPNFHKTTKALYRFAHLCTCVLAKSYIVRHKRVPTQPQSVRSRLICICIQLITARQLLYCDSSWVWTVFFGRHVTVALATKEPAIRRQCCHCLCEQEENESNRAVVA